jgi:hypothetical protein
MMNYNLDGSKNRISGVIAAVFCLGVFVNLAWAQSVSSKELIDNAKNYDGKIVLFQGEAIGEIMKRGGFAWININDGENAIGVWAPITLLKDIFLTGNYRQKGDLVEVSGVFNKNCPEHGGDLDIHAREIRKVSKGRQIPERINFCKARFALTLIFILGLVWILSLLSKRWIRK